MFDTSKGVQPLWWLRWRMAIPAMCLLELILESLMRYR